MNTYVFVDGFGKFGSQTFSSLVRAIEDMATDGKNIQLYGIQDPSKEARKNAEKKAKELGVSPKIYDTDEKMDEDISMLQKNGHDIWVYNVSPSQNHFRSNEHYIKKHVRVLSEKPLVLTIEEKEKLMRTWDTYRTQIDHAKVETENPAVIGAKLLLDEYKIHVENIKLLRANSIGILKAVSNSMKEEKRIGVEGGSRLDKDHDRAYITLLLKDYIKGINIEKSEIEVFNPYDLKSESFLDVWGKETKKIDTNTADGSLTSEEKIITKNGNISLEVYTGWLGVKDEHMKTIKKIKNETKKVGIPLLPYASNTNIVDIGEDKVQFDYEEIRMFHLSGYEDGGRSVEIIGNMIPPRNNWDVPGSANFLMSIWDEEVTINLISEENRIKALTDDVKKVEKMSGDQMTRLFKKSILGTYPITGELAFRDIGLTLESKNKGIEKAIQESSFEKELKKAEKWIRKKVKIM